MVYKALRLDHTLFLFVHYTIATLAFLSSSHVPCSFIPQELGTHCSPLTEFLPPHPPHSPPHLQNLNRLASIHPSSLRINVAFSESPSLAS